MRKWALFLLILLCALPAAADGKKCLTFTSQVPISPKISQSSSGLTIEIPMAIKVVVEGQLPYALTSTGSAMQFQVRSTPSMNLTLELSKTAMKVCSVETVVTPAPTSPPGQAQAPKPAPAKGASTPNSSPRSGTSNNPAGPAQTIDFASLDLPAPESPAFTVLGLTPQTIVRPNTPLELASTLINGLDQNGNFQNGIAIDTAPYMLFAGNSLTLYEYDRIAATRFLSRSQVSFATAKGASESDKSLRTSVGLRFTLWDRGDPRTDQQLIQCFDENLNFTVPIPPFLSSQEKKKLIDDKKVELEAAAQKCRDESRKRNWNASSWVVAGAPAWISPDGTTSAFNLDGYGVWTSFAYGFENVKGLDQHAQLIFNARLRNNESVPDPKNKGSFIRQNSTIIGGRLRFGTVDFHGDFEGAYIANNQPNKSEDRSYQITAGFERKLASNFWLNLSIARASSTPSSSSHLSFLSNLTWHFSKEPAYKLGPNQ